MSAASALARLLWRDVFDRSECSCVRAGRKVVDQCALCEAWQALGMGKRWDAKRALYKLPKRPRTARSAREAP